MRSVPADRYDAAEEGGGGGGAGGEDYLHAKHQNDSNVYERRHEIFRMLYIYMYV